MHRYYLNGSLREAKDRYGISPYLLKLKCEEKFSNFEQILPEHGTCLSSEFCARGAGFSQGTLCVPALMARRTR